MLILYVHGIFQSCFYFSPVKNNTLDCEDGRVQHMISVWDTKIKPPQKHSWFVYHEWKRNKVRNKYYNFDSCTSCVETIIEIKVLTFNLRGTRVGEVQKLMPNFHVTKKIYPQY